MRQIQHCPVAVVGGAGFLGTHLINHLIDDRQCDVWVLDNLHAGRREWIHPKAHFEWCDITQSESRMYKLFQWKKIEYVFNYAAEPYIPVSFQRPLHVLHVNAVGAMQVINAAHEAGARAILQVSSAELYGEAAQVGKEALGRQLVRKITEWMQVAPHSSYGAAKAAIDYFVQCRWREARCPCIALRQFNCVGERETHPYVIPEIIGQLSSYITSARGGHGYDRAATWEHYNPGKLPVVRLGNNSFRDFLYAGDQARMAVELLEKGEFGEVYNLGSESGIKIYDLAALIGKTMGFNAVQVVEDESRKRPWEIWHLQSDNAKVYSIISTRPSVFLQEALRRTVDWFQGNGNKWPWQS